jgi:hypothetical protein
MGILGESLSPFLSSYFVRCAVTGVRVSDLDRRGPQRRDRFRNGLGIRLVCTVVIAQCCRCFAVPLNRGAIR